MKYSASFYRAWLRGFWDGEGCVSITDGRRFHLEIANTDRSLADFCAEALTSLCIPYLRREVASLGPRRKPYSVFTIATRQGMRDFARQVGFQSVPKKERLARLLAKLSHRKRYRETVGRVIPTAEMLHEMYIVREMTTGQIAVALGYGNGGRDYISKYLNNYAITRRTMAEQRAITHKHRVHPCAV